MKKLCIFAPSLNKLYILKIIHIKEELILFIYKKLQLL